MTMSYEDRIREALPGLSPSLRRLADFLLDSYIEASFLTATELAHTLDLDPATVVRFSQRIGYPGYPELQREIRERVRRQLLSIPQPEGDTPAAAADAALLEAIQHLEMVRRGFPREQAERLLKMLEQSERTWLVADGVARPPAEALALGLEQAGFPVQLVDGSPAGLSRALAGALPDHVFLALAADDDPPFVARGLEAAREAGIPTAAIVAAPSLEAGRRADVVVALHTSHEPALAQLALFVASLALIRMLARRRPDRVHATAQRAREFARLLQAESERRPRPAGRARSP